MARPKRFELLTPRFVVKANSLKSPVYFANYVKLVTRDDKGLHLDCKPFGPFGHVTRPRAASASLGWPDSRFLANRPTAEKINS